MNATAPEAIAGSPEQNDSAELVAEQARIMNRIRKDSERVRRLRVVTVVLWSLFVVGFVTGSIMRLRLNEMSPSQAMMLGFLVMALALILIVAVVCTASLYIRWRSLSQRQLMASLAGIEKALEELSTKLK